LERDAYPTIQVITDATAMSQAGRGPSYIQRIITDTVTQFWSSEAKPRTRRLCNSRRGRVFNPNMQQSWFVAVNQLINNVSVLAIFLTGAAVLREREHGNSRTSPV
jgi:ABC-2 type transport system permease protein